MFAETIENEEILKLPRISYPGEIKVIASEDELNIWLPHLLKSSIIGFDTETKPSFKKGHINGVALLQLATDELALIIRVAPTGIPKLLVKVFQDSMVLKVGAAIHDDIKLLQKVKPFKPQGFIDLQNIAVEKGIENKSVRKLAAIVLNVRVSKSQQLSNWESETLTEAQLQYAATDAWICSEIYKKMILV
ncbi:MAG: 3'-5' exonuclease domain-containing protein 2 [Bacteroidales bacterium]|nr:MAG: 3'-5' exonuclease domain-containing protein 2 [Bacteroidales bacterium]